MVDTFALVSLFRLECFCCCWVAQKQNKRHNQTRHPKKRRNQLNWIKYCLTQTDEIDLRNERKQNTGDKSEDTPEQIKEVMERGKKQQQKTLRLSIISCPWWAQKEKRVSRDDSRPLAAPWSRWPDINRAKRSNDTLLHKQSNKARVGGQQFTTVFWARVQNAVVATSLVVSLKA